MVTAVSPLPSPPPHAPTSPPVPRQPVDARKVAGLHGVAPSSRVTYEQENAQLSARQWMASRPPNAFAYVPACRYASTLRQHLPCAMPLCSMVPGWQQA